MDSYIWIFVIFSVYEIVGVNGQGGGVAIPWGHGVNINMADFDPFSNIRGLRKPEPNVVRKDPYDPYKQSFAPDPPHVGGIRPGGWSRESSSSEVSSSLSSSEEFSSSTEFRGSSISKPRDSGGVAIRLNGPFPGNETVNDGRGRFPAASGLNASALNVHKYPAINSSVNQPVYANVYNALNVSMYPGLENSSYSDMSMFYNTSHGDMSVYADNVSYPDMLEYGSLYNASYGDMQSMYSAFENASNTNNNTLVDPSFNTTDRFDAFNGSEHYFGVGGLPASMADLIPNETMNGTAEATNETRNDLNFSDLPPVKNNIASVYQGVGGDFVENVAKMTNGLFVQQHLPNGFGKVTVRESNSHMNSVNADIQNQHSKDITQAESDDRSNNFSTVNEKLRALNKLNHASSNDIVLHKGVKSLQNSSFVAMEQSHPPPINVPVSWNNRINVSDSMIIENAGRMEDRSVLNNAMGADFNPFKRTRDERYETTTKPAESTSRPRTGMGVPVSFGFNLPSSPIEKGPGETFVVDKFVSVPVDQGTLPGLIAEEDRKLLLTPEIDQKKSVKQATAQRKSATVSDQLSNVNIQRPSERITVQQPAKQEPEPYVSRQPLIETQPAVDFMSSFLSQPIDPTRRGDRQKTVDTHTDINIVPLENQQMVEGPSQTLVQDGRSRDWRSFISSFLMGGGPGFEQMGPASFSQVDSTGINSMGGQSLNRLGGPQVDQKAGESSHGRIDMTSNSQMEVQSRGQAEISLTGSVNLPSAAEMTGSASNQMSGLSTRTDGNVLTQNVGLPRKPAVTDFGMDQTVAQMFGQTDGKQRGSLDMFGGDNRDMPGSLLHEHGQKTIGSVGSAGQSITQGSNTIESTIGDSKPRVFDLTSSRAPVVDRAFSLNPVRDTKVNSAGNAQLGINTQYEVVQNGPMENVIGLSDTRPLDTPLVAEAVSVPTQVSAIESPRPDATSVVNLGLSDRPLTTFEGASPSDLQKLKLLEVAQRLLLQERGLKDPLSRSQSFTPLGMSGSVENLLSSLNQANNMAEMIKSSLSQGSSQTSGMTSAESNRASFATPTSTQPPPKRNIKLGEWSSGASGADERRSGVPIGNIFAGRFLQSGTGIPSVGGSVSPTVGIPISQSLASRVANKLTSALRIEPSTTTETRGGGFVIKDKLPLVFQRECNAVRDPTSKYHFYRLVGGGRIRFRCALGTAFDDETCECSIRVISNGDCLEVHMNFNNGQVEDVSRNQLPIGNINVEVTNRTSAYPGIAVFDGTAKLTVWRYQNYDFRDHVMLKLRFRPGLGGDRYQTILANCDGSPDGPPIAIIYDKLASEVIMTLRTDLNSDKDLRFKVDPDSWSEVTYLYDGNSFIGLVNNNRRSMPTQGLVIISDEALVLGHCPRYGNFNGAVDDVKIYTCIPKDNRFLL